MSKSDKGTVIRSIRVDDNLWNQAKAKAESEGLTLSDVVREALEKFVGDTQ